MIEETNLPFVAPFVGVLLSLEEEVETHISSWNAKFVENVVIPPLTAGIV